MINSVEVPKSLMGSFKRVARRIPVGLKNDEELIKTVVAYLQLGGEKLARQAVEAARQTLELKVAQKKKKAREEALIRAAEARLAAADAESDASEDDFDDDDDEDDKDDNDDVEAY
jgi:conjugal transfer/entry exclusion protein